MSSIEKLIIKLKNIPADFKYSDLRRILKYLGYQEDNAGKTSGSRVQFVHQEFYPIIIHKPHPGDEVNRATLRDIISVLTERNQI